MLVSLAKSGNIKALEELIFRIQKNVYSIFAHLTSNKDDISDLTQDVLLKMARSLSQLKKTENFRKWLNQIIYNTYHDYIKKTSQMLLDSNEQVLNSIKDKISCEPGERCFFSEVGELIKAALMTLPKDLRITIILREVEGLSYDEISKITKTTLGTVKSRISRARMKLQEELKNFI